MMIFLVILIDALLTILYSINTIAIGVATILDFDVWGLLLTILFMWFGGRHFCRCVNTIILLRKNMKG